MLTQAQKATCTTSDSGHEKSALVVPDGSDCLVVEKNTHFFCVLYRRDPVGFRPKPARDGDQEPALMQTAYFFG